MQKLILPDKLINFSLSSPFIFSVNNLGANFIPRFLQSRCFVHILTELFAAIGQKLGDVVVGVAF